MHAAAQYLARNLVSLRAKRNWSQQALSNASKVPRTSIANMESGQGNPALKNLCRVAAALNVSLEELLARPRHDCVLIKADNIPLRHQAGGDVSVLELLPEKVRGLEIIQLQLKSGARKQGKPHLQGTKEYLYGLQGCLSVLVAGDLFAVHAGDVLAFPGDQAHSYINRAPGLASAISIVVPVPVTA